MPEPARFYRSDKKGLQCLLCPNVCRVTEGGTGACGTRSCKNNMLFSDNYGAVTAAAVDPIEKKPLYHFYPGSDILSLGTFGCNLKCSFCQNSSISQGKPLCRTLSSGQVVNLFAQEEGIGIAYTYSEPGVWFEFVIDCAKKIKQAGGVNVLVTNGFVNREPLLELLNYADALNIDLKSFNNDFYKDVCGAQLAPVKQSIITAYENAHVEITHLVVTGLNDNIDEFKQLVDFIYDISPEIPLHISRYRPSYRYNAPPTPESIMNTFYDLAVRKLHYVYVGNMCHDSSSTKCPECDKLLINRSGYRTMSYMEGSICTGCGKEIYGVF